MSPERGGLRADATRCTHDSRGGGDMIPLSGRPSEWRQIAWWMVAAVVAAVLMVVAFRAYLNPSALIDFANSRLC